MLNAQNKTQFSMFMIDRSSVLAMEITGAAHQRVPDRQSSKEFT